MKFNFLGVCVESKWLLHCAKELRDKPEILLVSVVDFPLGSLLTKNKVREAMGVTTSGAKEIDMVINFEMLKLGYKGYVRDDIRAVVEACKVPVKVIIETCYLTNDEKVLACELIEEAGAKFVKTSTGLGVVNSGTNGATVEDVELIKKTVGDRLLIKASGGIKGYEAAKKLIEAGANRIGTSAGIAIVEEERTFLLQKKGIG